MPTWPIWKRLLCKEFRESGIVLAVGVLLALLLIPYRKYGWVPPLGTILIGLILILWATYRAQEDQARYRMLLPQSPLTRWLALLLLPLPVPLFFGLCIGFTMHASYFTDNGYHELLLPATLWFMAALFILATALTVIYSAIPAILTGVVFLMTYLAMAMIFPEMILYFQRVILSMAGALLLWAAFRWRRWHFAGRVVIGLSLVVMACWPMLRDIAAFRTARIEADAERDEIAFRMVYQHETTMLLDRSFDEGHYSFMIENRDKREPIYYTGADLSLPLDLFPDEQILVGQQDNGATELRLLRWNPASEPPSGRELCRVAFPRKALYRVTRAFVRPDARYAVLVANSKLGPGSDLWVVDLAQGRTQIAMANVHATSDRSTNFDNYWRIGWSADDRAVLSFLGELCEVNLATMRGRMVQVGMMAPHTRCSMAKRASSSPLGIRYTASYSPSLVPAGTGEGAGGWGPIRHTGSALSHPLSSGRGGRGVRGRVGKPNASYRFSPSLVPAGTGKLKIPQYPREGRGMGADFGKTQRV